MNSPLVTQGKILFPTYGLAIVVEKEFLPLEASPLVVGIIVPPRLLNHVAGNWILPFVTRVEFTFLPLVASPLVVVPYPSPQGIATFRNKRQKT